MNLRIVGIGIDIVKIDRFSNINLEKDKKFLERLFTQKEIEYCFSRSNPSQHLATRFAGKEAVIKALDLNKKELLIEYKDIEILLNKYKKPFVNIKQEKFDSKNIQIHISLSHSEDDGIAFAITTRFKEKN